MDPSTEQSVPEWVDEVVDRVVAECVMAAGPGGSLVLCRKGESRWRTPEHFIDNYVGAEHRQASRERYMPAMITRLRARANKRVPSATFHPMSQTARVELQAEVWYHVAEDGAQTRLASREDACRVKLDTALRHPNTMRLARSGPTGIMAKRMLGAIDEADLALLLPDHALLIPCAPGASRKLVLLVETYGGLDVFGFGIRRPLDARLRAEIESLGGTLAQLAYYPMWREEKGKNKLRVLKLA